MSLYKQPGSQVWWANISVPGHPRLRRSTGETDRIKAQRVHDEIKASLWVAPRLKGYTWGKAVLLWAEQPGRSQSDVLSIQKFCRLYKDRLLGDVTADSLTAAMAEWKNASTWMRYRNRIVAILNLAKAHGWVKHVPELPTKRVTAKPRAWLTPDEWGRLYAHLPPHQRRMALFAIETGLRQTNVLTLKWTQVDLDRRLVWYEAENMKGARSLSVPLSDRAFELLKAIDAEQPKTKHVFTYKGRAIKEVKTAFQAACVEVGLGHRTEDGLYRGFTWHGLRHTWATWHVQNGTPLSVLQQLGGWACMDMVLHYAHHSAGFVAEYANNNRRKK